MKTKTNPDNKMWRTLVRVAKMEKDGVFLLIPGRGYSESVWCPKTSIPEDISKAMKIGKRYHVQCNFSAPVEEIKFNDWENQ